jgi:outer membrane protein
MKVWQALALALLFASSAVAQEIKLGYVDLQRALNDSESGKRAKDRFKKEVDRLQGDLQKQKSQLEGLKEQLDKKSLVMKDEERRNLEKDYQKRLRDFERSYKDSQGELQQQDNELTASLLRDLQKVIEDYGKARSYTMILERSSSSVLYGADNVDLTDDIIAEYNKKHP